MLFHLPESPAIHSYEVITHAAGASQFSRGLLGLQHTVVEHFVRNNEDFVLDFLVKIIDFFKLVFLLLWRRLQWTQQPSIGFQHLSAAELTMQDGNFVRPNQLQVELKQELD